MRSSTATVLYIVMMIAVIVRHGRRAAPPCCSNRGTRLEPDAYARLDTTRVWERAVQRVDDRLTGTAQSLQLWPPRAVWSPRRYGWRCTGIHCIERSPAGRLRSTRGRRGVRRSRRALLTPSSRAPRLGAMLAMSVGHSIDVISG